MKQRILVIIFTLCLISSFFAFAGPKTNTDIKGITGDALKNVAARLEVLKESHHDLATDADIRAYYQDAPSNIKKALEPYGYFKSSVQSKLSRQGEKWKLEFDITPGPALTIKQVELSLTGPGKDDRALKKLINNFPLKAGQPLSIEQYDKAKDLLFETANNQGYLKAELIGKEVKIDLKNYTAVIILHLDTGLRYYFGNINFNETPFSPDFLHRFLNFKSGEPFSSEKLLKFQQDLTNSRYFTQVIVTPEMNQIDNLNVPVKIDLAVPKSQQYSLGVGYGTFTGPRLTIGADFRRVGDSGQHFTTQIKWSTVLKGLAAKYFIPGRNPLTDQYTIGADIQKYSPKNGESFSQTLSAGFVKTLPVWQYSVGANYLLENYRVKDQQSKNSRVLYPNLSISRIKADNLISPTHGSAINLTLQGANNNVLSTTSFLQAELKAKYIFSPTTASKVILRGDLGYTAVKDLTTLPLTMRFFAGGLGSVRGYPFDSIGPGRYLEVASAEFRHQIYDKWDGAVFYDVGTATDHFNQNIMRGAGVGVIYNSLIGPVQLYVGRALSKKDKPYSLEFTIGPDL